MTTATKTEYDMRDVAAHKFWQDARPGDRFQHPAGQFPNSIFTFVKWHGGFNTNDGHRHVGVTGSLKYLGRSYDYYMSMEIDDRVIWYKQVPWKGMTD